MFFLLEKMTNQSVEDYQMTHLHISYSYAGLISQHMDLVSGLWLLCYILFKTWHMPVNKGLINTCFHFLTGMIFQMGKW